MATELAQYCLPALQICRSMADWKDFATAVGTLVAIPTAVVALYKATQELRKAREQRNEDLRLRRTEFTLSQHRRLFDDPAISGVLRLLDDDSAKLAEHKMWDDKRKFLTFFEELCLLIKVGYVNEEVALYLFGYYATAAYEGKNFRQGMAWEKRYWGLFFKFATKAQEFLKRNAADMNFDRMAL